MSLEHILRGHVAKLLLASKEPISRERKWKLKRRHMWVQKVDVEIYEVDKEEYPQVREEKLTIWCTSGSLGQDAFDGSEKRIVLRNTLQRPWL